MKNSIYKTIIALLVLLPLNNAFAQKENDPVFITIANENIAKSEFLNLYKKNNLNSKVIDKKNISDYLDLYINFRLKVYEAKELKLDTSSAFKKELNGYRKQLAKPYLTDNELNKKLVKQAYERSKYDIRASHILIKLIPDALPKDTIIAYNKIMNIRDRILKGENFEKVALETSEDPSVKDVSSIKRHRAVRGNSGDLGYLTVFDMVYPFETTAYNTKVNEISMPVRTKFGYHIIKVTDKIQAIGKIQLAHIFINVPKNDTVNAEKYKNKIDSIYQKLKNGENFAKLAKQYSDDKNSANKGGIFLNSNVNRILPEFVTPISKLKKTEDFSEPVLSRYGWHIIKLINKEEIKPFKDTEDDLKTKVERSDRYQKVKESFINKIKKQYAFKENIDAKKDFYTIVDDKIFEAKWDIESAKNLNKQLFTIADKNYTQQDFAKYINSYQSVRTKENIEEYINRLYNNFVDQSCISYEESQLDKEYPEFRMFMKEYNDGMLLFELTDKKVWSKAIKDTVGLKNYYEKNKNNYMWSQRLNASVYECDDNKIAKQTQKLIKKGYNDDNILNVINKDSLSVVLNITKGIFSKSENKIIDSIKWEKGISEDIVSGKKINFVVIHEKIEPQPKTLAQAKGLVTADYQKYLENEWTNSLKKKYPVSINEKVLTALKQIY